MRKRPPDSKVFISGPISTCGECKEKLGRHAWVIVGEDKGVSCLSCDGLCLHGVA